MIKEIRQEIKISPEFMNFISKMCSEGYIPQEKYKEQETLFRNDKGKWINGKYYTKDALEKMKKNNGYEL